MILIVVPVCGTMTLFHLALYRLPRSALLFLTQYDRSSLKTLTPFWGPKVPGLQSPNSWSEIGCVRTVVKVESYELILGRASWPSAHLLILGCESTGRIRPWPGCR